MTISTELRRQAAVSRRLVVGGLVVATAAPAALLAQTSKSGSRKSADEARLARQRALTQVTSWGAQLRLLNFPELAGSPTDMLVIDHGFSDGVRFLREFDRSEIEHLKTRPDGRRRLVISYMSIGEAETYRWYWPESWFDTSTRPSWIGPENPRWPGNFPVDYWAPDWQRLIVGPPDSYVARIMRQGFDGFYLDRADVYDELKSRHPNGAKTMSEFVARIAASARSFNPEAIVILQNAEELIAERTMREAIDAVSKEDLYYGIDHTEAENPPDVVRAAERDLRRARAAGKRVFLIEYVTDGQRQKRVIDRASTDGFLPYFAPRDLRRLVTDPASLSPDYAGPLVPQERPLQR